MKTLFGLVSMLALLGAGTAQAQVPVVEGSVPLAHATISGGVSLWNKNVLDDLYIQTPRKEGPVAKGWLSIPLGEAPCSVELFGAHGLQSSVGAEADIGA